MQDNSTATTQMATTIKLDTDIGASVDISSYRALNNITMASKSFAFNWIKFVTNNYA